MPIYEYECTRCGKVIEVMQKFSDPPLTECEACHGSLRKLISMSTFHLKGTGWYVTDYARKGTSSPSSSDKKEGKDSSGSTEKD
ncbi:FmdB family zinc ribbon protein [Thermodesulforhabdus norvegica]|uniref:Putative regulatory protein, FmdB family n=1 Tax=Thermodesulforhabdus norvegica TaxID=39841 RepID=A0A1I4S6C7_9BACT|nr:FmdB family zinc ribbon protein [Thermodesulforhabdus norvegica]SFM60058.1 putative regulatory protein, FmdB family [Thermodesulforhabdus norvegica]